MAKKKITEVLLVLLVVCAMLTGLAVTVSAASTQYSFTYYTGSDNSMGTICVLANENSYTELANSGTYGGSANQLYFLATANPGYKLVGFYYTLDNGTTQFTEGLSVDTFEAYFKKEYDAFVYWNNANSGADPHSKMIVQAVFEATQFTITATAGTGGTVSGGGVVANGGSTTITATPSTGYKFTGWYNSSNTLVSSSASYALSNVKANATYTAKFEKQSYTISVNAGTGGTASGGGTVKYGESVTITATAEPGYTFIGWYKGDTKVWSDANHTISSVNTTATYTAKFQQNATYQITYTVDGVLRDDLTPTSYIQGIGATLPKPTKTGYTFKGWYKDPACEDGQGYGPYSNLTAAADGGRAYYGKFVPNTYTITVETTEGGTVSGGGSYEYGTSATLVATPSEGYLFEGWYYGDSKLSSEASYTLSPIEQDATYTAKFIPKEVADEGSFSVFADSGYYGEYGTLESGIIAFNASYTGYENEDITAFGLWLYVANGKKISVEATTARDLKENAGKFFATVSEITPEQSKTPVFAIPYVVKGSVVSYGEAVSEAVNTEKWLGEKE